MLFFIISSQIPLLHFLQDIPFYTSNFLFHFRPIRSSLLQFFVHILIHIVLILLPIHTNIVQLDHRFNPFDNNLYLICLIDNVLMAINSFKDLFIYSSSLIYLFSLSSSIISSNKFCSITPLNFLLISASVLFLYNTYFR